MNNIYLHYKCDDLYPDVSSECVMSVYVVKSIEKKQGVFMSLHISDYDTGIAEYRIERIEDGFTKEELLHIDGIPESIMRCYLDYRRDCNFITC